MLKYNSQKYERNNEWVIYREDIIQETILAIYESCGEIVKKFYFDTGLNILRMEYIKKNIAQIMYIMMDMIVSFWTIFRL